MRMMKGFFFFPFFSFHRSVMSDNLRNSNHNYNVIMFSPTSTLIS